MKIEILDYLKGFSSTPFCYVPNPGNAGDSVIAAATYLLFDKLKLDYSTPNRSRHSFKGEVVVYGGGGNLGKATAFSAQFLQRTYPGIRKLIILPHTIREVQPLLESFGSNVDIICREKISYEYVKNHATQAHVYLADDMAFYLELTQLLSFTPSKLEQIKLMAAYATSKLHLNLSQPPALSYLARIPTAQKMVWRRENIKDDQKILYAFRTDAEKTNKDLPLNNIDISEKMATGVETKYIALLGANLLIRFINTFDEIYTNRLHVCISAALLGKKVHFYSNSYYKCKAVYDMSMNKIFKNVTWHEQ